MPELDIKNRPVSKEKPRTPVLPMVLVFCLLGTIATACAQTPQPTRVVIETATLNIPDIPAATTIRTSPTETPFVTATAIVAEPIKTPTRSPTSTPTLTPTPQMEDTIYSKIRSRLKDLSNKERAQQKAKNSTRYAQQIDPDLENIGPTILLIGCGDDYVASNTHKQKMCANSEIILGEKQIKRFNLTHDTGFPKQPGLLVRSDELWLGKDGGFSALRDGWQSATRAPVDFVIVINDYTAIGQLVGTSFGGKLKVDVPLAFTAQPIWLDGKPTGEHFYEKGVNELDQREILQYLAATPNALYPPELENQQRVQTVLEGMWQEVETQRQNYNFQFLISFFLNSAGFLTDQVRSGNIVTDSDLAPLVRAGLETTSGELVSAVATGKRIELSQGKLLDDPVYLLDPEISPDKTKKGLRWGTIDDPFMKRYIQSGGADPGYYEIPDWNGICQTRGNKDNCGANFYTSTPELDYWPPVSQAFKDYVLRP